MNMKHIKNQGKKLFNRWSKKKNGTTLEKNGEIKPNKKLIIG